MKIGVLALQGAVREHVRSVARLGAEGVAVRTVADLRGVEGVILPGGESTAISLLGSGGLLDRLQTLAQDGLPLFGTCAGMILLAKSADGTPGALAAIDLDVSRNATGRQIHSFETALEVDGVGKDVPAVFIRAPSVTRLGPGVTPLARHRGSVVMARQRNVLVAAFHPELTDDLRIHGLFLGIIAKREKEPAR